jgi:hypothetical protein
MSFEQGPSHLARLLKAPLPYVAVGAIAVVAVGEGVHVAADAIFSEINGVTHDIGHGLSKLQPGQAAQFEAQEALDSVSLASFSPVVTGNVMGSGSLDTFKTFPIFGGKVPGTTDGVNLTQTGIAAIMAPQNAIVSRKLYELPGSTTADPKFAATLEVNADTLYPQMLDSATPVDKNNNLEVNNHDGALPKVKYLFFGGAPDGKYTAFLTNIENDYLKVDCAQAMMPLVPAGFQHNFYMDAKQTQLTPSQSVKKNAPEVAQYLQQIGNGSLPVTVKLVNSEGQPVDPQSFKLKDAADLMSKEAIAKVLDVSKDELDFNFSSQCESKPKAVEQQVAIQEGYAAHTGETAAVTIAYGG